MFRLTCVPCLLPKNCQLQALSFENAPVQRPNARGSTRVRLDGACTPSANTELFRVQALRFWVEGLDLYTTTP